MFAKKLIMFGAAFVVFCCSVSAVADTGQLGVKIERNVRVPMRDGTILRADVYRPDRGGPYPVLVQRTPYGKSGYYGIFVKAGYIIVNQDSRGRYESEGKFESYWQPAIHDAEDGYDTVEWAARLPGSTGKVGTLGISYPAFLQWRLASLRPPSLVAMSACSIPAQIWYLEGPCTVRPGFRLDWLAMMAVDMRRRSGLPGVHAEWERVQLWEGESQKWLYWLPWLELPQDFFGYETDTLKSWLKNCPIDPWRLDEGCKNIAIPNLDMVGWYDHANGDLLLFRTMVKDAMTDIAGKGSRIIIGPWSHGFNEQTLGAIDFGYDVTISYSLIQIRWFDYWLKGVQNGVDEDTPVRIFVMGDNKWRDEQHWPLQRSKEKILYIASDGHANTPSGKGRLILEKITSAGIDNYVYDPSDPVPTPYGTHRPIPADQRALANRQDILVYQTEPLTERVEVTGNPVVELYAASSAPDTDWFVRLIDVAPDGLARDVSSGMVRARYRNGYDKIEFINPNEAVKCIIRMGPTSNAFLPGHRIRLDITSSDFPNYDRNHNTAANQNADARLVIANQRIYHGGERATRIILPWIPNPVEVTRKQDQLKSTRDSICRAIDQGDSGRVKQLISEGIDVNVRVDTMGRRLLHYAARSGNKVIVEALLANGADVNCADVDGTTAIEIAFGFGNKDVAEMLLSRGARTSFIAAAVRMEDEVAVKNLLEQGVDVNTKDQDENYAIHYAADAGKIEMVQLLIEAGADVNVKDWRGRTPLHLVIQKNDLDKIKLLIAKGADVYIQDDQGMTPLGYAISSNNKNIVELLLVEMANLVVKDGRGLTVLHNVAVEGRRDIAELLLSKGAKVDGRDDNYEFTALHYAARFGTTKVAEVLIAHGADIKAKDKWDYQPIHWAAYHDRPDIVKLLIAKGADVNAKTSLGQTPLELAKPRRNTATIEVLRKHGAK